MEEEEHNNNKHLTSNQSGLTGKGSYSMTLAANRNVSQGTPSSTLPASDAGKNKPTQSQTPLASVSSSSRQNLMDESCNVSVGNVKEASLVIHSSKIKSHFNKY